MHKLMFLNDRFTEGKPVHTADLHKELAEKLAVNGAVRAQGLINNKKTVSLFSNGHKALLNHDNMKKAVDKLMNKELTPQFDSFAKVNKGKIADLLKTNGKDLSKRYDEFRKQFLEVKADIQKAVKRGMSR